MSPYLCQLQLGRSFQSTVNDLKKSSPSFFGWKKKKLRNWFEFFLVSSHIYECCDRTGNKNRSNWNLSLQRILCSLLKKTLAWCTRTVGPCMKTSILLLVLGGVTFISLKILSRANGTNSSILKVKSVNLNEKILRTKMLKKCNQEKCCHLQTKLAKPHSKPWWLCRVDC